jgi:hypothetical protein
MIIEYQAFMMLATFISTIVGGVLYVGKIKNDLGTRIAVLEHGHEKIDEDLKEIKQDVKELLRTVTAP